MHRKPAPTFLPPFSSLPSASASPPPISPVDPFDDANHPAPSPRRPLPLQSPYAPQQQSQPPAGDMDNLYPSSYADYASAAPQPSTSAPLRRSLAIDDQASAALAAQIHARFGGGPASSSVDVGSTPPPGDAGPGGYDYPAPSGFGYGYGANAYAGVGVGVGQGQGQGQGVFEPEEGSEDGSYDGEHGLHVDDEERALTAGHGFPPPAHENLYDEKSALQAVPSSYEWPYVSSEQHSTSPPPMSPTVGDDPYADPDPYGERGRSGSPVSSHTSDPSTTLAHGNTQHFGPAPLPGAQIRRHKSKKKVQLTHGNLVLDCPVPTKLAGFLSRRSEEEFVCMRYTAATCDPDSFAGDNFSLRPQLLNRHTELFICITMYNEDEKLFTRTLHGVFKNIAHLCTRNKSRTWGPEGWKKVVVAIVADGRRHIHPRVLDCLAALGVYQDGVAKNMVNGKKVEAHIFEYTTQLSIDENLQFKGAERGLVPIQILFCLKENNAKKINSHRWCFNAFGPLLQPNIYILLDVGTKPANKSIYYLWKAFDLNSNVAGACGEICAEVKGKWGIGPLLLNPLVAAQNFEYKISNILDKPTESVFGYISVLPGAFSAYRYIALQNDHLGHGPLASYFKGESLLGSEADVFTSNMYLAEDRILCFELAAKRNDNWVLKYVKSARGITDVPDTVAEFISQRRRWLNGSFFAAVYSLAHAGQILRSGHSVWRKTMLLVETVYNAINLAFSWFGLANFYIFFTLLTRSLEDPMFNLKGIEVWNTIVQYVFLGVVIACFIFAMGNRPQGSKWKYMTAIILLASMTVYMIIAAIMCTFKAVEQMHNSIYVQMVVSLLATYGVYLLASLLALDPAHLITSFAQYILLSPTYICILNIYAFCNLHDFSWGTKAITTMSTDLGTVVSSGKGTVEISLPTAQSDIDTAYDEALFNLRTRPMLIKGEPDQKEKEDMRMDYYKNVRTNVVLAWALSNGVLAALILNGGPTNTFNKDSGATRAKVYMLFILIFVAGMSCVRFLGSTLYLAIRLVSG